MNERIENWLADGRRFGILVGLAFVIGFILRMIQMGNPLFGDELSTLWIVRNHGFFETVSVVSGDAEITPPLYFMLSWLTTQLGSSPDLVRLPALVAGLAIIPMTALLGLRTVSRTAGLLAAVIVAISPYMTYFSANGRAYSLMICFLIGAVLAMLAALRTGRARWWAAFAVCAALAMYSHYMGGFVLAAVLLWLLIFHRDRWRPALLATAAAAIAYIPWVPGLVADNDSPTKPVLEQLQGDGLEAKWTQIEQWLVGQPVLQPGVVPGRLAMIVFLTGVLVGLAGTGLRLLRERDLEVNGRPVLPGLALIVLIAAAVPVAELVLFLFGTDLLGARNLAPAWAGLPVLLGALVSLATYPVAAVATLLTVASFAIGAVRMTDPDVGSTGYGGAARFIEKEAGPGDVIMDSSHYSPVPLTQLDTELAPDWPEYRVNLPRGEPPYLPLTAEITPADQLIREAFADAARENGRVFAVTAAPPLTGESVDQLYAAEGAVGGIPPGWHLTATRTWDGYRRVTVNVFERNPAQGS